MPGRNECEEAPYQHQRGRGPHFERPILVLLYAASPTPRQRGRALTAMLARSVERPQPHRIQQQRDPWHIAQLPVLHAALQAAGSAESQLLHQPLDTRKNTCTPRHLPCSCWAAPCGLPALQKMRSRRPTPKRPSHCSPCGLAHALPCDAAPRLGPASMTTCFAHSLSGAQT